jgi:hypothetical protein
MGSLTGFGDSLYFTGPYSTTSRKNLTILASDNNGLSFDRSLTLWASNAGYSGLQCGLPTNATAGNTSGHDCAVVFDGSGGKCDGICFMTFSTADVTP